MCLTKSAFANEANAVIDALIKPRICSTTQAMRYNFITFILSYFADVSLNSRPNENIISPHLRIHLYPLNYLIIIIICWLIITQTPSFDFFDSAKLLNCVQRAIAMRACCYPFGHSDDAVEHRIDKKGWYTEWIYIFRECWFSKVHVQRDARLLNSLRNLSVQTKFQMNWVIGFLFVLIWHFISFILCCVYLH